MEVSTAARRLTAAEAEALWRSWKTTGDSNARDRLVLAYAPMVKFLTARKVRELPSHCELEDLVSCGLLALMTAVDRFDPAKGATFEQYAWTRVSGAIVDELRRQDWASRSVRRNGREIEQARDRFVARHGVPPNEGDLAGELKVSVTELRTRVSELERAEVVSLNAPVRGGEDGTSELGDMIVAGSVEFDPEQLLLTGERSAAFRTAIQSLSERERRVLELVHVHHMPGAEIGRELGVSESRVSQILSSVRAKLKRQLAAYELTATAA